MTRHRENTAIRPDAPAFSAAVADAVQEAESIQRDRLHRIRQLALRGDTRGIVAIVDQWLDCATQQEEAA